MYLLIYRVNIQNIKIQINNIEEVLTQDETLEVINANVIALCISNNTNLYECVGFGMYFFFFLKQH